MTIDGSNGLTFPNSSVQAYAGGLGSNTQTWQNVTGSRAFSTTYTNSTGFPIAISIMGSGGGSGQETLNVNGIPVFTAGVAGLGGGYYSLFGIVPNGATYSLSNPGSGGFQAWNELR